MKTLIGIDIGGTKVSIMLGNEDGHILGKITHRTSSTYQEVITLIHTHIAHFLRSSPEEVSAIGISCGGPLDPHMGVIQSPPNLPTWDNIPIVRILSDAFHLPVFLENDANACGIAEWKWGAGKGYENVVFLTFGTGLGAGLILNGSLYRGSNFLAGEVGHVRMTQEGAEAYGKKGSAESFCSGTGISRLATLYGLPENTSAEKIFTYAEEGDERALKTIQASAIQLGNLSAMIIDMLNPDCIIIGSIYSRQKKYFYPIMKKIISQEALSKSASHCNILKSTLGERIGDLASLGVAMDGLRE